MSLLWMLFMCISAQTVYAMENADINFTIADENGNTSLHRAVQNNSPQLVKELLARGAPASIQNKEGKTPLHYAFKNYNQGIVACADLLLEHGARIDIADNDGKTSKQVVPDIGIYFWMKIYQTLTRAIKRGKLEKIALLLKQGASGAYTFGLTGNLYCTLLRGIKKIPL